MSISVKLATLALNAVPRTVSPDAEEHAAFFSDAHLSGLSKDRIDAAMYTASHDRLLVEETDRSLELFFSPSVKEYLQDKRVLDFGCFFGGTALAWEKMYGTRHVSGFDVSPTFIEGANRYAKSIGSTAEFKSGVGENAPFPNEAFDTIVSFDVFEHVYNLEKCLDECWRMLAPNGHLIAIFPTYWHPYEHHIKVSKTPLVHWFFSGETLRKALNKILASRGPAYAHFQADPNPNYRLPDLNGITVRQARKLLENPKWTIVRDEKYGIPKIGRRAQNGLMRMVSKFNSIFASAPLLDEIFLDRVAVILRKN